MPNNYPLSWSIFISDGGTPKIMMPMHDTYLFLKLLRLNLEKIDASEVAEELRKLMFAYKAEKTDAEVS